MRFLLVLAFAFAAVAYGSIILPNEGKIGRPLTDKVDEYVIDLLENDGVPVYGVDNEEGPVEIAPLFVISWQVRRAIRKLQKQMPCGWKQYGIPPLAPLKMREAEFHWKKGILETFDKVLRFRVDGLDDFKINKLKLNVFTKKVTFDFLFKNVKASATKYETNTILNALRELGLSVQYEGDGTLEFGLQNLRIAGVMKYKLPVLWGSAKITSLKTTVTVQKVDSNIVGFMGEASLNRMVNRQVEMFVYKGINDNTEAICNLIEDNLVPRVNKMLKGKDFWTLIDLIFSSSDGENEDDPIVTNCVPPADPWDKI